mmetsp:Transcript_3936/g.4565  ORF Transcript_3936/g.4565 Transcript_3936/m.4565 type:complete len:228 (-) Transcript_3936:32-715(-)|eukprot:CAMPEP_0205821148 /NCGR_PEP_ID=MMETSP0206-20130828/5257_1 /ASSEMBLY_ACC=CAM_ASM_000279 /TAXON_ID=36767 /ORGANISM="Euplotes focardii, Strain TN1" /LENGTH=227 /DNA_ID=CAMNT_0053116401 /DNA_START=8 /DNA_END=691 /DNA_ORIENTATION=+
MPKSPRFRVYERISKEQAEYLLINKNSQETRDALSSLLDPVSTITRFALEDDSKIEEKAEIILDFHSNNFEFTQTQKFNEKKTATFLELMHALLEKCMVDWLTRDKAMELFKTYLLRHSIQRPPHSLFVFNLNEVKAITDYVQGSFLKFYAMYQYAIIPKLELELQHDQMFYAEAPGVQDVEDGQQVKPKEIPDLMEYLNEEDLQRMTTLREGEGEGEDEQQQEEAQ